MFTCSFPALFIPPPQLYPSLMLVAVSPYHLTTREPAAIAALLLADRVVTLLPGPDRRGAELAAERLPHYLDFVLTWEWSVPL
jgi:hypothetical protein